MEYMDTISILYIEDDDGVRNSIERILALMFKKIVAVSNGLEALEAVRNNHFDIIVTDIRMPKMDGFEFIEAIKKEGYSIPVVITSAFNEIEYLTKAIELKVDKFIHKPIKVDTLTEVLSEISKHIINERDLNKKQQELEYYRNAVEQTNLVIKTDENGLITKINKELKEYFELFVDIENIPNNLNEFLKESESKTLIASCKELKIYTLLTSVSFGHELFSVQLTAFPSSFEENSVKEISIIINNVSHITKEKDRIIADLYKDNTTQLPNRAKLFSDLSSSDDMGLVLVDIDNFSHINYLFGMPAGDTVLMQVADILQNSWPDKEDSVTAYRIESDHFALLVKKYEPFDIQKNEEKIQKFIENLEAYTFNIEDNLPMQMNFTVGASCENSINLFTEASIALVYAKATKEPFVCFSNLDHENINNHYRKNFDMQSIIKTAVQNDNVTCHYQSIQDKDANIVKYEALMRIKLMDKKNTIIYPGQFLEIAQNSKFYSQMTKNIILTALTDFNSSSHGVSINVSYDDISNSDVVKYLIQMIKKHSGTHVTVELLESEGLKDIKKTIDFCHLVKEAGADIAIDDFGSGYSNFGYFIDMPIDYLKLDGSLVKRIHEYRGYLAVESIVLFAKKLNIKTVAEYVETKEDFEKLQTLGVDLYQGYYFSAAKAFLELNHQR